MTAHPGGTWLTVRQALDLILSDVPRPERTEVPLDQAAGHVLAEPVTSDLDMPPFDKSLMDGLPFARLI